MKLVNTVREAILAVVIICTVSCSDKMKTIQLLDIKPTIGFIVNGQNYQTLTDSIRLYNNENYYTVNLNVNDIDDNIWKLYYKVTKGTAEVFYNKQKLMLTSIRTDLSKLPIDINALSPGLNVIDIITEDKFNNSATATLNLFAFSNLAPVALLTATKIAVNAPLEYKFDASKSFDQDKSFGGKIVGFIYEVEGNVITTTSPTLNYIFQTPGIYTVNLKVIDNNGDKSNNFELKVTVN